MSNVHRAQRRWNQKQDNKPFLSYFALTLFLLLLSAMLF